MHYHHRIGGEWQPELLREARELLNKIHEMSQLADKRCAEQLLERIGMALDDDINTLEVIDAFHAFALSCSKVTPKNAGAGKELVLEALDLVGLS
jgi:cysteinyl-tRNA synthetase